MYDDCWRGVLRGGSVRLAGGWRPKRTSLENTVDRFCAAQRLPDDLSSGSSSVE